MSQNFVESLPLYLQEQQLPVWAMRFPGLRPEMWLLPLY
jgi:hypothetical protein